MTESFYYVVRETVFYSACGMVSPVCAGPLLSSLSRLFTARSKSGSENGFASSGSPGTGSAHREK